MGVLISFGKIQERKEKAMSTREGQLITCERCGKQLFQGKIGKQELDGGYTTVNEYAVRPKGWELVTKPGGKGYMEVCPGCWEDYMILLGGFWGYKKEE